jgi:hypothetical protein
MMKVGKKEEHMDILSIFISSIKKVKNYKKKKAASHKLQA